MCSKAAYFPGAIAHSDAKQAGRLVDHDTGIAVAVIDASVTDEELLCRVVRGSKDALSLLFRKYRRAVMNVAARILRDSSEAEDLCQEVFLLLFKKATLFNPSKGAASSWIIQIAYHRAMNLRKYLTHRQRYETRELDEEQISAERQPLLINEIAARNLLNRLRDQLTEEQRETLELHFFDGYSFGKSPKREIRRLGT
jgi:RNA polymerase sigma-70 factor (ECF subfamily)